MTLRPSLLASFLLLGLIGACGPGGRHGGVLTGTCDPGDKRECYSGVDGTDGTGPCHSGEQSCGSDALWGPCEGQVAPAQELCGDNVDNNCNGMVDENADMDGDGITTCGGDCCDSTECGSPALVNAGAFDVAGDGVDNDCNGVVDDAAPLCDQGLASNSANGLDYAKAIDICQTATMTEKKWGVISAEFSLADGTGTPAAIARSIRPKFGNGVLPKGGTSLALLSTGAAAGEGDSNPAYQDFQDGGGFGEGNGTESAFPQDFVMANSGTLPNAPGCPEPSGDTANDPIMLTLTVRVPTNAKSFKFATDFFSSEFPEYTCSPFNDFFVVLLDSAAPGNPPDKNLAVYTGNGTKYPVGVNLASGNTGLFTQCVNGSTGCVGTDGTISTCTGTDQLSGTGLDTPDSGNCDSNSLEGGGTGWLETSGNVNPGEIMKLRIAIWDTSDHILDSIAVIDGFQWSTEGATPGTVILREAANETEQSAPQASFLSE
jgi:hypothetical protein